MLPSATRFFQMADGDPMETITFEVDTELYKKAKSILAEIGMTIEDATALFLKAVVARKGLPFPLTEAELDEIRNRRKEG